MAKLCIALGLCAAAAFFSLSQFAVQRDREENRRQLSHLLSRFAVSKKVKEWALRSPLFQPLQDKLGSTSLLSQIAQHPREQEDQYTTTLPALDWFATATQQLRFRATTSGYAIEVSSQFEEDETEPSTAVIDERESVSPESVARQQESTRSSLITPESPSLTADKDLDLYETTDRAVEVTTTHELIPELAVNENKHHEETLTSPSPTRGQEEDETEVPNRSSVFVPEQPELNASPKMEPSETEESSSAHQRQNDATIAPLSNSFYVTELPGVHATLTAPSMSQQFSLAPDRDEETTILSGSILANEEPKFDPTHITAPSVDEVTSLGQDNEQKTFTNFGSVLTPENQEMNATLNHEGSVVTIGLLEHVQDEDFSAVGNFTSVYTTEEHERYVTVSTEHSVTETTPDFQNTGTTPSKSSSVYTHKNPESTTLLKTQLAVEEESTKTTTEPLFSESVNETADVMTAHSKSNSAPKQEDGKTDNPAPSSNLPYQEVHETTVSAVSTELNSESHQEYTTTTEPAIEEPPGPKIVCYFTSWSMYREGRGRFTPEDVDAKLCTHIIYAFASLNSSTLKIVMADPWADADNELYQRVTALKASNRRLRVLLSLGGWGDSGGSDDKYSRLAADETARRDFAQDAVIFLKKHRFDGLDLDWEYPNCASGVCPSNPPDVENFALLLKDLREAFDVFSPPLLLSTALSGNIEVIEEAYNVPEIFRHVDFASVMTYDYYGPWSSTTGHYAPFQAAMDETNPEISIEYVVNALMAMGAPASQLVLGVPFFSRSFTLANPRKNTIGAPISGAGKPGPFTDTVGLLAYYEICSAIKAGGWTQMLDPDAGVYAYSGDQWVCFDGPRSIMRKARFALRRGLAGLMAWDLSMDDFLGVCGRSNPLLNAVRRALYPPSAKTAAAGSG